MLDFRRFSSSDKRQFFDTIRRAANFSLREFPAEKKDFPKEVNLFP
jgi:hypothetical protein